MIMIDFGTAADLSRGTPNEVKIEVFLFCKDDIINIGTIT